MGETAHRSDGFVRQVILGSSVVLDNLKRDTRFKQEFLIKLIYDCI